MCLLYSQYNKEQKQNKNNNSQPVSQSVSLKSTQKYINIIGFWLVCDDNRKSTNNHRYAHNSSCHVSAFALSPGLSLFICLLLRSGDEQRNLIDSIQQVIEKWIVCIVIEFDRIRKIEALANNETNSTVRQNQHNSEKFKRNWCWPSNWMVKTKRTTTLISFFFGQFLDLLFELWWCAFCFARLLWIYDFLRIFSLAQHSKPIIEVKFDSYYVTLIANEVHTKWFELWW